MKKTKLSELKLSKKLVAFAAPIATALGLSLALSCTNDRENTWDNGTSTPGNFGNRTVTQTDVQFAVRAHDGELDAVQHSKLYMSDSAKSGEWAINMGFMPEYQNRVNDLVVSFIGALPTAIQEGNSINQLTINVQGYHKLDTMPDCQRPTSITQIGDNRGWGYFVDGELVDIIISRADLALIGQRVDGALNELGVDINVVSVADVARGARVVERYLSIVRTGTTAATCNADSTSTYRIEEFDGTDRDSVKTHLGTALGHDWRNDNNNCQRSGCSATKDTWLEEQDLSGNGVWKNVHHRVFGSENSRTLLWEERPDGTFLPLHLTTMFSETHRYRMFTKSGTFPFPEEEVYLKLLVLEKPQTTIQ